MSLLHLILLLSKFPAVSLVATFVFTEKKYILRVSNIENGSECCLGNGGRLLQKKESSVSLSALYFIAHWPSCLCRNFRGLGI